MIQQQYIDLLHNLSTDKNSHSGRTLLEHLKGTHDYLMKWGNPQEVCVGGLFHSIYGTQSYKTQSADLSDRQRIAEVIGLPAEELAYLFCTTNRKEFFTQADTESPVLTDLKTGQPVPVSTGTLRGLIEVEVANCIEQFKPERNPERYMELFRRMLDSGTHYMTEGAQEELQRLLRQFA